MKAKQVGSLLVAAAMLMTAATGCAAGDKVEKVLKIGGIGPTTGAAAVYGEAVKNGAEMAVEEINKAGGIAGMQIEFKFQDDENDPEKSVNAYNNLKDWGMNLLMGTVTSNPCVAVADKTKADNMFQLTPSGSSRSFFNLRSSKRSSEPRRPLPPRRGQQLCTALQAAGWQGRFILRGVDNTHLLHATVPQLRRDQGLDAHTLAQDVLTRN